jgi:hypothetical protein
VRDRGAGGRDQDAQIDYKEFETSSLDDGEQVARVGPPVFTGSKAMNVEEREKLNWLVDKINSLFEDNNVLLSTAQVVGCAILLTSVAKDIDDVKDGDAGIRAMQKMAEFLGGVERGFEL